MILLDANVISELWRINPSPEVSRWIDRQPAITLFISAVTLAELSYGAMRLGTSKRRDNYIRAIARLEAESFEGRVLAFDRHCASAYGQIRAAREAIGRPILAADAVIVAITKTQGLRLATRNVRDFEGLEIELINPFEATV